MARIIRTLFWLAACALAIVMIVAGVKGAALWALSKDIDTRTQDIAAFYRRSFDASPLQMSGALLTADQREAIERLPHIPLTADLARIQRIDAIIDAQHRYLELERLADGTPLAEHPQMKSLQEALQKNGGIQTLLDGYNAQVQTWNNAQDGALGTFFWKAFRLEPRYLLTTDGTKEIETTATL